MSEGITPKEVIKLIAACRASGVKELALGNLRIVMDKAGAPDITIAHAPLPKFTGVSEATVENIRKESIIRENAEFADEAHSSLMLEEPGEYERQLVEGELDESENTQNL